MVQIEFVQSSVKTGCGSSLPPVRSRSPCGAEKQCGKFGLRCLNDNEYDVTGGGVAVHIEGTELHQLN